MLGKWLRGVVSEWMVCGLRGLVVEWMLGSGCIMGLVVAWGGSEMMLGSGCVGGMVVIGCWVSGLRGVVSEWMLGKWFAWSGF